MFAALEPLSPSRSETLDAIGRAFSAALAHDGGPRVAFVFGALALVLIGGIVFRAFRETRREKVRQKATEKRHDTAMANLASQGAEHDWLSVPGHLPLTLQHERPGRPSWFEECKTQRVSGAEVAFSSQFPPPPGERVHFTLALGERAPLRLRGVVAKVEPATDGGPPVVAVTLGPVADADRDRVARWVAHEEGREIALARRGPLCAACGRPVDAEMGPVHPSCERSARRT